jgi:hypothetical protein
LSCFAIKDALPSMPARVDVLPSTSQEIILVIFGIRS